MQRYKKGDPVLILPQFAHLYRSNSAIVLEVKANRSRPMFNSYTIQFADGSTDTLFEFQLIEDEPGYTTVIAALSFDSHQRTLIGTRGKTSGRQLILRTSRFDIDIKIRTAKSHASIMGQVLERETNNLLKHVQARLMKAGMPLHATTSDDMGVFEFRSVSRGSLNLLVIIPEELVRILSGFSI